MAKNSKSVTIEMVASEAGVSKTTVSFVINNNPSIGEQTRKRVLEVIRRLGYQPNINARNLSTQAVRTVCIVVPEVGHLFNDPYFAESIGGAYDEIEASDFRMILHKASHHFAEEKEYFNLFRRKEISGMISIGSSDIHERYLREFAGTEYPIVLLNSAIAGVSLPCVLTNNVRIGRTATRHLISLGHRQIAHILGSTATSSAMDRLKGYRQALDEAGIDADDRMIVQGHFHQTAAAAAVCEKLLKLNPRPTAIYAASDVMAFGVLDALALSGVRVPEDCAVVGSDDVELAKFTRPALTTVRMPIYDMARAAVRMLMDIIHHDGKLEGIHTREDFDSLLVVRDSCGTKKETDVSKDRRKGISDRRKKWVGPKPGQPERRRAGGMDRRSLRG